MEVGSVPSQGSPGMAWPSGSSLWLGVRKAGLARATGRLGEGSDLGECSPGPWGLEMGTQLASNGIFASVAAGWKGVRVGGPSLPSSLAPAPTLREGRLGQQSLHVFSPWSPGAPRVTQRRLNTLGRVAIFQLLPCPPTWPTLHPWLMGSLLGEQMAGSAGWALAPLLLSDLPQGSSLSFALRPLALQWRLSVRLVVKARCG